MDKALIGGTGVYSVYEVKRVERVDTPYGMIEITIHDVDGEEIAFLPRHGKDHSTPPHKVNYRGNMMALKQLGIKYIYGLATSGSMDLGIREGAIVVVDDFIDFTDGRIQTFFDGEDGRVVHVDMSDPYCSELRKAFIETAEAKDIDVVPSGTYVCVNGPRFETRTEIQMYKMLGATISGMTNIPEVNLAKELGMCYAAIGLISNMCCGIHDGSIADIDHGGVIREAKKNTIDIIFDIFRNRELTQDHCHCSSATLEL